MLVLTDFSAGLDLCICGGTNCTGKRCERKYSLHSNEVSLSQTRLGRRGRECSERADILVVRGVVGFLGGEVTVIGDKDVLVSATRFHGQLTGEVESGRIIAGNSTVERGGSLERWDQGNPRGRGWEERREASARENWKGEDLEERRLCRTTSR